MKLKTIIIDDEPIALEKLRSYIEKVTFLELVAACQSCFDASGIIAGGDIDLVVMDINMPDLNGMDFIKTLSSPPMVIFTTAYSQYAVDSYKISAVDYLLKPYSFVDFQRAVNKALRLSVSQRPEAAAAPASDSSLFVKVDSRYARVALSDIRYIKGYGEYLQIYVAGSRTPMLTLSSFMSIKERLTDNFIQVHRSYIVNMEQVQLVERGRIVMDSDTYIPVGDSYKSAFRQYLATHSIGRNPK